MGFRALNFNTVSQSVTVQYGYISKVGIELLGQLKRHQSRRPSKKERAVRRMRSRQGRG